MSFFYRVKCINLRRRDDRWHEFNRMLSSLDGGWPFVQPERAEAVDGDACTTPSWWSCGGGAWGCMMSHARILEEMLLNDWPNVLILEDDVVFVKDFAERFEEFIKHVPEDWDQIYFGGQHLHHPKDENDRVFRCVNVNRTHAHAVSQRFARRMYRHILNAPDYIKRKGHHIDHRLGALHETGTVNVFAPKEWMAGQAENKSDISGRTNPTYFWNTWRDVPNMEMTVILDVHCGVGGRLAALMRENGFHFGKNLGGIHGVEDSGIARICEDLYPFPTTKPRQPPQVVGVKLTDWVSMIVHEAADYGKEAVCCYPTVSAMHKHFASAWPKLRVIEVRSCVHTATNRMVKRTGWVKCRPQQASDIQLFLMNRARKGWAGVPRLVVLEGELDEPEALMRKVRDFTGAKESASRVA